MPQSIQKASLFPPTHWPTPRRTQSLALLPTHVSGESTNFASLSANHPTGISLGRSSAALVGSFLPHLRHLDRDATVPPGRRPELPPAVIAQPGSVLREMREPSRLRVVAPFPRGSADVGWREGVARLRRVAGMDDCREE